MESNFNKDLLPLDREGLEALLVLLAHDTAKPRSTVTMFLNILDEVLRRPEERDAWIRNVEKSFSKMEKRLEELRVFTLQELEAPTTFALDPLLTEINSELKAPLYSFDGTADKQIQGDMKLLKLFFMSLLDWMGVDVEGWKKSGTTVDVIASKDAPLILDFHVAAPLPEASTSLPARYLARALCEWIAKLHHGFLQIIRKDPAHVRITLPSNE